ncbi:glycosyltransferase family 4 protein, partial [Bacteroides thetaiotaomicron]
GFNTGEEQRLAENILGKALGAHGILSVGIEESLSADWAMTKEKFQLPEKYLLYIGRITPKKIHRLLTYFVNYKKKYSDSTLRLVLVGGLAMERFEHPDVIYTGFVSDEEKMSILQHADIVVNPSRYESLSLILLEAMSQKRPMLVNGHCKVLKEHCLKSDFASFYYMNNRGFNQALRRIEQSEDLREEMGEKGVFYVKSNYNWTLIMGRLKQAIKSI